MLSLLLKSVIAFTISFVILSFKFNDRPLFSHITSFTGPLGQEVQNSISKSMKRSARKSKKLFTNSDPKILEDAVNNARSSTGIKRSKEFILEELRKDEVKKLDEIIRKNK